MMHVFPENKSTLRSLINSLALLFQSVIEFTVHVLCIPYDLYFHSMLAGGADGFIVIYDICNTTGNTKYTCQSVGTIALNNRHRHKFSVETVLWYPLDTGMFTSSGTDKLLKIWDTNRLKVKLET